MLWLLIACTNDKDSGVSQEVDTSLEVESEESPSVSLDDMMLHLTNLDSLAQDNSNNRALGTSGGLATRSYLKETLADLGYRVWTEPFTLSFFQNLSDPILQYNDQDYSVATFMYSAAGEVICKFHDCRCSNPTWT